MGGGNTAAEEALYLSNICSQVNLVHRRNELRAEKILQDRIFDKQNIKIYWNSTLNEVLGDELVVNAVELITENKKNIIESAGVFIAIGHQPNTFIFKDFLNMDENGYIITKPGSTETNIKGVFATGDAQDNIYRQAVTAAGTGCMGALDAERYVANY